MVAPAYGLTLFQLGHPRCFVRVGSMQSLVHPCNPRQLPTSLHRHPHLLSSGLGSCPTLSTLQATRRTLRCTGHTPTLFLVPCSKQHPSPRDPISPAHQPTNLMLILPQLVGAFLLDRLLGVGGKGVPATTRPRRVTTRLNAS